MASKMITELNVEYHVEYLFCTWCNRVILPKLKEEVRIRQKLH